MSAPTFTIFSIFNPESNTPVLVIAPEEIKKFLSIASQRINPPFQVTDPEVEERLSTLVVPVPKRSCIPFRAVIVEVVPVPLFARTMLVFPERGIFPEITLFI